MSKAVVQEVRALTPKEADDLVKDAKTQFCKKERWRQKVFNFFCGTAVATGCYGGWIVSNLYFTGTITLNLFIFAFAVNILFFGMIAFVSISMKAYDEKIHVLQDGDRNIAEGVLKGITRFLTGDHKVYYASRGILSVAYDVQQEEDRSAKLVLDVEQIVFDTMQVADQHGGLSRISRSRLALQAALAVLLEYTSDLAETNSEIDKDSDHLKKAYDHLRQVQPANDIAAE